GAGGAGKSVGLLSRAFTLFTGPVGIAIGVISLLVGAFTLAYKKSEIFRNMIKKVGSILKETFSNIMDYIRPGIDAIKEFFGSLQDRFRDFMQNEGPQFKKALDNIKSVLS